jgi:hypothetical protein
MTTRNAIVVVSRQPEWLEVMDLATSKGLLTPKYWITYPENHNDVAERFPNAIVHARVDANRAIPPASAAHLTKTNSHFVNFFDYSKEINLLVDQIDRIDVGETLVLGQKRRLADTMIAYWLNVIQEFDIDIGVFGQSPHSMGNYALYIALLILQKQIRIFRYTGLDNLHFVANRLDTFPEDFDNILADCTQKNDAFQRLSQGVQGSITAIRNSQHQVTPWYIESSSYREAKYEKLKNQIEAAVTKGLLNSRLDFKEGPFKGDTSVNTIGRDPDRTIARNFKVPGRNLSDAPITAGENKLYKIWSYGTKFKMKKEYEGLISDKIPEKYVYFAFNYQPERTTNPDGGFFSDHYRCFAIMDAFLPDDVSIVVKEHPNQFSYVNMGDRSRWHDYYSDFQRSKRCVFVAQSISSHNLISNAAATATVTGMAGWESLNLGKPVFSFGATWYSKCRGVLDLSRFDIDKAAVRNFLDTAVNLQDIDAYGLTLETTGRKIYTTPTSEKGFNEKINMTPRIFDLLHRSL